MSHYYPITLVPVPPTSCGPSQKTALDAIISCQLHGYTYSITPLGSVQVTLDGEGTFPLTQITKALFAEYRSSKKAPEWLINAIENWQELDRNVQRDLETTKAKHCFGQLFRCLWDCDEDSSKLRRVKQHRPMSSMLMEELPPSVARPQPVVLADVYLPVVVSSRTRVCVVPGFSNEENSPLLADMDD